MVGSADNVISVVDGVSFVVLSVRFPGVQYCVV